jgi:hypothetical protein
VPARQKKDRKISSFGLQWTGRQVKPLLSATGADSIMIFRSPFQVKDESPALPSHPPASPPCRNTAIHPSCSPADGYPSRPLHHTPVTHWVPDRASYQETIEPVKNPFRDRRKDVHGEPTHLAEVKGRIRPQGRPRAGGCLRPAPGRLTGRETPVAMRQPRPPCFQPGPRCRSGAQAARNLFGALPPLPGGTRASRQSPWHPSCMAEIWNQNRINNFLMAYVMLFQAYYTLYIHFERFLGPLDFKLIS